MLEHTFIHVRGVGPATELRLWSAGLTRWEQVLNSQPDLVARQLKGRGAERFLAAIDESRRKLSCDDASYFGARLASAETWRAFADFGGRAAYLDIETDGYDRITTVVVHREGHTHVFIRDRNLHELPLCLAGLPMLVTYNGRSFDWPMLLRHFSNLPQPGLHLDLRGPFARLGFRGGLKGIEKALRLDRPGELAEIDGWSAVWLWHRHRRGDKRAMPALVRYCAEDVLNLKYLAEWVYNRLAGELPAGAALLSAPSRAVCDELPDADAELMAECRDARTGMGLGRGPADPIDAPPMDESYDARTGED